MRVMAFAAVKGGVGKTTAAVNVGAAAARSGVSTVIWDLDPQAAACHLLDIEGIASASNRAGLLRRSRHYQVQPTAVPLLCAIPANTTLAGGSVLGSTRSLRRQLHRMAEDFDLLVLDLAAGVDATVETAVRAGAEIVVPIAPSMLSRRAYAQLCGFVASISGLAKSEASLPVRGFANMVDPLLKRHVDFVEGLRLRYPELLDAIVPHTVEIERACEQRLPVAEAFPNGRSAAAFAAVWEELARS